MIVGKWIELKIKVIKIKKFFYDVFTYTGNCNVDYQWRSIEINVYKRGIGIVNDDHHQNGNHRRSSTRKSSMLNPCVERKSTWGTLIVMNE